MKKELKKDEIMRRIAAMVEDLNKSPEEYCQEWNEAHPDERYRLDTEKYYPFMVGTVAAGLQYILNGGI